jgi:hypothetical protein
MLYSRRLTVAGVGFVLCHSVAAAQSEPSVSTSILQLSFDSSYQSAQSLEQIMLISKLAPPRIVHLPPGGSISELIVRTYGFGKSDSEDAYKAIESAVKLLNGITDLASVPPQPLKFPAVPRIGYAKNSAAAIAEASAAIPRVSAPPVDPAAVTPSMESIVTQRRAATDTVLRLEVDTKELYTPDGEALLRDSTLQATQVQIAFRRGAAAGRQMDARVSIALAEELATLSTTAKRRTRLFVLDSGWPQSHYIRSRNALWGMINSAGREFGLSARRVGAAQSVPRAKEEHAEGIAEALSAFEALDTTQRVEVIFVPLSRDQGAATILEDLIAVSLALQNKRANRRADALQDAELLNIGRQARAWARGRVQNYVPATAAENPFVTDKALLDAIWEVAEAAINNQDAHEKWSYVVNQSWTVPGWLFAFTPLPGQRGLAVAAAGNLNRDIAEQPYVHFAYQAVNSSYVVAVMNLDDKGVQQCDSSLVGGVFASTSAVAFDGRISNDCGTSFAAPRVAWLIAAAESKRKTVVDDGLWVQYVADRIKSARFKGDGLAAYLLDPVRLMTLLGK